jgi:hypothetical protein
MQKFLKAKFHIAKDVAIPGDLTAEQAIALAGKLNKAVSEAK